MCVSYYTAVPVGGGKSVYQLAAALQYVDTPGYNAILFRKTFADLMLPGALIPMSQEWLAPFLKSGEVVWKDKDKRYIFKESGATLSHLDTWTQQMTTSVIKVLSLVILALMK